MIDAYRGVVSLSFNVSQIGSNLPGLLLDAFGVGRVRGRGDGDFYFEVTRPQDLEERVFPFFDRFPLRGSKADDLRVFREIPRLFGQVITAPSRECWRYSN